VLTVEDKTLVAQNIREMLLEAEGISVGPAANVNEARQLIKEAPGLDAALLDVNLSDGLVTPVLEALSACGVPMVVRVSGIPR
jgi:DNA-binding response OmpR family regulator